MFKFKHTRRTVAGLAAVVALAGGFGAATAAPERADAAAPPSTCGSWEIPSDFSISQRNGYLIWTLGKYSTYTWSVNAWYAPSEPFLSGRLHLTRFDTSGAYPEVRFTITWDNGSAGVYRGTIDGDGFLVGTTSDRFNGDKAGWNLAGTLNCLG